MSAPAQQPQADFFEDAFHFALAVSGFPLAFVTLFESDEYWLAVQNGNLLAEDRTESPLLESEFRCLRDVLPLKPESAILQLNEPSSRVKTFGAFPLVSRNGFAGYLCITSHKRTELSTEQAQLMERLASQVTSQMDAQLEQVRLHEILKKAERERLELRTFYDNAPFLMGLVELQGTEIVLLNANKQASSALHLPQIPPGGLAFAKLGFEDEFLTLVRTQAQKSQQLGRAVSFIYESHRKTSTWMRARICFAGFSPRHFARYSIFLEDITREREQMEEFGALVEQIPLPMALLSREGEIEWTNPPWESLFGEHGSSLAKLFPAQDNRHTLMLHLEAGRKTWKELAATLAGGRGVSVAWVGSRLPSGGQILIGRDLSETKLQEQKIQEQQIKIIASAKMSSLGEMAGSIAHEINNPLAIIHARLDLIMEEFDRNPPVPKLVRENLEKIKGTTHRIAKIVRGLKAFSRNGEGDPFMPVAVTDLITETLELTGEKFKRSGVDLRVKITGTCKLDCRSVQISQVLVNLLSNAHDAVKGTSHAWIELEVEPVGDFVQISVTDGGGGIPREIAERIMEPFFTTKEVGIGTGLGLSISKGIVEDHHGSLRYDPKCPNTRFIVLLPTTQSSQNAA